MKLSNDVHFDGITKKAFKDFLRDEFITYASSTNKIGLVKLGVDSKGDYAIKIAHKTGTDTHFYDTIDKAINAYGEFLD